MYIMTKIKKIFFTVIITVMLILISSIITYQDQRKVDGLHSYGFPFANYESCGDCVEGFENGFVYENIFINLFIYNIIVIFVMYVTQKIKK